MGVVSMEIGASSNMEIKKKIMFEKDLIIGIDWIYWPIKYKWNSVTISIIKD